jgi:uncharacterized membrane protein
MILQGRRSPASEWTIAFSYAATALIAGLILPRVENLLLPGLGASISVPVALTLYSAITSGMIALTAIVFSLAFVMVQFSAVAYSPRLVLWVSRDRVLWHSIGMFTATFLYAIGAMVWVDRAGSGKVPLLSGWLVIGLMLASTGMFVALIQRIGLLQVSRILAFTGDLGRQVIEQMYPPLEAPPSLPLAGDFEEVQLAHTVIYSGMPRALQAIDRQMLLQMCMECDVSVEVLACVGETLLNGAPLLRMFGEKKRISEKAWAKPFITGEDRTFEQDPKYAIRLLVDIAIKALSPAINDPTTAVQALDQIQDQLLRLGNRRLEIGAVRDLQGKLRLAVPHPTWDDFLRLAFEEIRSYGAGSVQVMRRMSASISDLIAALPQERHAALEHQRQRLNALVARSFPDEEEKLEALVEDRQGFGVTPALNLHIQHEFSNRMRF